ncbi:MAG: hypothetical protein A3J30_00115 [Candidatus Wildermuthbacteria bacterium RIFCSPLOWO2_02_FULL_47_9c]|uniref:Uncharacterized protein n=2 Tax=Patescibacteria group TaxID=1783273 RepID=A0A0G0WDC6_9BACT|nr:MAG: hypothetical protein UU67_C0090G0005 [Candidatus Daviesbacteria bacterium GW2011_GWB1_41_5]OHA76424.1 MAG: hypothetical protein A3J30_00115 [Candidatus Wildermuthbacteria bacterium RIFCSPLOWO2_02_FULL_47_9c]
MKYWKDVGILLISVGVGLFLWGLFIVISTSISLSSSIEGVKDRAQVAADAAEIRDRLILLDERMEARGMHGGFTSLFVHSPWTDVSEIRENVKRLIGRADTVAKLDPSSDAYQQGLDDIRGTLREFDLQTFGWWTYNAGGWVFICLFVIGGFIVAFIGVIFWRREDY